MFDNRRRDRKTEDFSTRYFNHNVEYPRDVAYNPMPWEVLWSYISSSYLNGQINYVKPIKAYVLSRYRTWHSKDPNDVIKFQFREPAGSFNWVNFEGTKQEAYDLVCQPGRLCHTDLNCLRDDIILLAEIEIDDLYSAYPCGVYESNPLDEWNPEHPDAKYFMFFWFDRDSSDCCIGRFRTTDSKEEVVESFSNYCFKMGRRESQEEGLDKDPKELPLHFLTGWLSW